jgi:anti-anti-sigma factor
MDPLLGPFTVVERAPGTYSIFGEIDMATAPALDGLADVHGPLLLDLHGVSFIDSMGIAALVRLHKRCDHDGCTLRIEACSPSVERVLRLVGLYETFTADGVESGDGVEPRAATGD